MTKLKDGIRDFLESLLDRNDLDYDDFFIEIFDSRDPRKIRFTNGVVTLYQFDDIELQKFDCELVEDPDFTFKFTITDTEDPEPVVVIIEAQDDGLAIEFEGAVYCIRYRDEFDPADERRRMVGDNDEDDQPNFGN